MNPTPENDVAAVLAQLETQPCPTCQNPNPLYLIMNLPPAWKCSYYCRICHAIYAADIAKPKRPELTIVKRPLKGS
jgi:hypothetical protein